jgi:hypothetical protein
VPTNAPNNPQASSAAALTSGATTTEGRLYNRFVQLTLAKPLPDSFIGTQPNATIITQMRVAFKIEKSLGKEPNLCEITVSNFNADTRSLVEKRPLVVRLDAGYGTSLARFFTGDLLYSSSITRGPTWETKIQVGDGQHAYNDCRVNRSFPAGTSALTVLQAICQQLGQPVPTNAQKLLGNATYQNSMTLQGPAQRELTRVLNAYGVEWSFQDERLQVLLPNGVKDGQAVLISQDTGMVGSPEFGAPSKDGKPPTLHVKTLLEPRINAGGTIVVAARDIHGSFRVNRCIHIGDTHAQPWYTEVEATQLSG